MTRSSLSALPRLLLPLWLAGCAITLVAPYDPVTDEALQDLAKKTEILIADVTLTRASYAKHASFYTEADGAIRAIQLRADLYAKNETEKELLKKLQAAYGILRETHQLGPFRESHAAGVRSLLRSLLHHELSKKRNSGVAATSGGS